MVKPESLRSQRQIIIDTEQLMADMRAKRKWMRRPCASAANRIAADQGALRRRYGQFLGEESTLFGKDDHDDDHDGAGRGGSQAARGRAARVRPRPRPGRERDPVRRRHQEGAAARLSAMWDAENALRAITPKTALPPEHKALEAIKELQQSERIYLHKTAFAPPPIKEDKRMSGDMVGAAELQARAAGRRKRYRAGGAARAGAGPAPVLLQARPAADTPFRQAWSGKEQLK
jgi:hypothetical protein